jgi:hypothetical protein
MALYACNVGATPPLIIEDTEKEWYLSSNSNAFIDPNPDLIDFTGNEYTPIKDGPKIGFKTRSGKIVLPAIYDAAGNFNQWGVCAVQIRTKNGQESTKNWKKRMDSYPTSYPILNKNPLGWFYINKKGEKIADAYETDNGPDYPTEEAYVRFTKNGKVGLMHLSGKIIIPAKYTLLWLRSGQTPWIAGHGQREVFKIEYPDQVGGTYGVLDSNGKEIAPIHFSKIARFYMGPNDEIVDVKNHQILDVNNRTSYQYDPSDEKKFVDRDNPRRLLVLYRDKSAYVLYRNGKKELAVRKEPLYDDGSFLKASIVEEYLIARDRLKITKNHSH